MAGSGSDLGISVLSLRVRGLRLDRRLGVVDLVVLFPAFERRASRRIRGHREERGGDTVVSSDEAYEGVAPRLDLKARREE
jgi:hypothetical protein